MPMTMRKNASLLVVMSFRLCSYFSSLSVRFSINSVWFAIVLQIQCDDHQKCAATLIWSLCVQSNVKHQVAMSVRSCTFTFTLKETCFQLTMFIRAWHSNLWAFPNCLNWTGRTRSNLIDSKVQPQRQRLQNSYKCWHDKNAAFNSVGPQPKSAQGNHAWKVFKRVNRLNCTWTEDI